MLIKAFDNENTELKLQLAQTTQEMELYKQSLIAKDEENQFLKEEIRQQTKTSCFWILR